MPVSLDVQDLKVRSLDVDFNEISWSIGTTLEDIFDYTFKLVRSEGQEGPWDSISPEMEDQYLFVDNAIARGHNYRNLFYKVIVTQKVTGDKKEFGPVLLQPEPDLIAVELRRHMNLLFREFAGRRCWVLPVRTFGQRCSCYNHTLQKRTKSGCLECLETSFSRGYFRPIETWVQIDPTGSEEQNAGVGPLQQENTTARLSFYPHLKPRDILIEGENIRWRVVSVSATEQLRSPVRQEVQIHRIPTSDIEYRISLDLGIALKDIWLSPSRNFSNPQTLEAFNKEEIPDIFGVYPPPSAVRR
jgi:hypothetical protein